MATLDQSVPSGNKRWIYPARCIRVIDGDTISVSLDAGFRNYRQDRLRILGVNAPEMPTPAGGVSKAWTQQWLQDGNAFDVQTWPLLLETHKTDQYGRYLAEVWRTSDGHCLTDDMLLAKMAVVYNP